MECKKLEGRVEFHELASHGLQPTLFGSVPSVAGALFAEDDLYPLFARKVWPVLAGARLR